MTIAAESQGRRFPGVRELRGWGAAVAVSSAVLVIVAITLAAGWIASSTTRSASYSISAPVSTVALDIDAGSVEIVGGTSTAVDVRRTDSYAFGRAPAESRSLKAGVLTLSSRCPHIIVGSCSAAYRVATPEDVAVTVHTGEGDIHLAGFGGGATLTSGEGNITVDAFCGFGLSAASRSGGIRVTTACAPRRLELSSDSGGVTALVPPGRYDVFASSRSGHRHVGGIVSSTSAPFTITVRSNSGDIAVDGGL